MSNPFRVLYIRQPSYNMMDEPSRFLEQQLGLRPSDEDFCLPDMYRAMLLQPQFMRPRHQAGMGEVSNSEKEFCVKVDVQHFKPDEIHVKTVDNRVVIHAKHEEKEDEHGYICREFTRQYVLPKDVDPQAVTSSLSNDGVLSIKAPKLSLQAPKEQSIPITCTHETTPAVAAAGDTK
ncbi:alpha-crystallin B chain-like [Gigantopelta aegis]|uniref:alpha-crystallin B chain-like n=1 Tax=Gigantopelta aegis TaxID=1735272 RepID=UPI001B8883D7|nr:alpha-crystallin B chain-like [Gigantopelta aegis]